ncbi:MAG: CHAT domain-containing protein [Chloroflexi bacterium]|nr:CHAT domain-containing protein [Chloroflexota bacterium]
MPDYADLEIGIQRWPTGSYAVQLDYTTPRTDVDWRGRGGPKEITFDFGALRAATPDIEAYGRLLSGCLFGDQDLRDSFGQARRHAAASEMPLRLRLFIYPSATELHSLRWETLRDPDSGEALLSGETVYFSRDLSSYDWRPVRLRPRGDIRALVIIASPSDLEQYQVDRQGVSLPDARGAAAPRQLRPLAPLDVAKEEARAREGLSGLLVTTLVSEGGGSPLVDPQPVPLAGKVTVNQLLDRLRDGYDILYLICHGTLREGQPWLYLENENGNTAAVPGSALVSGLSSLEYRPRLVVLASCQSAGAGDEPRSDDEGVLSALGPQLAEAGIPAVIAMQGNVTMKTVETFMPAFFRQLDKHGQIDRAVAAARSAVAGRPDAWMPVLFMRLKSGRVWTVPGVAGEQPAFEPEKWSALLGYIADGACTPILGPGLTEAAFGSRRDVAQQWAEECRFPMAPYDRDDLPQVAQYRAVAEAVNIPPREFVKYLRARVQRRFQNDLPPELLDERCAIADLIAAVGKILRARDSTEPHRALADLGLPLYVTTNPDSLLQDALAAADRPPEVDVCRWNRQLRTLPSIFEKRRDYRPSRAHPLIFQLFGTLDDPRSLVLTQDNYFDFLIGVTADKRLIPAPVRSALTNSDLLFLGFQMDDWNFRVLFRSILALEGSELLADFAHVAVQIDPEESRITDLAGARRYLERFFGKDQISIYWGSIDDFVRDLVPRRERGGG